MEQLRQQQLELAKAPVVETPPAIAAVTPAPAAQTEDAVLAPAPPEEATPAAAEGEGKREGGEVPVGVATGEVPETRTATDEVAADGQPVTPPVQDTAQDSEESRKRRESMRNNAEQVCSESVWCRDRNQKRRTKKFFFFNNSLEHRSLPAYNRLACSSPSRS